MQDADLYVQEMVGNRTLWSMIVACFVGLLVVVCAYTVTMDLQSEYNREKELWKINQWWWENCNNPEFVHHITDYSTRCKTITYIDFSSVKWQATFAVFKEYLFKTLQYGKFLHVSVESHIKSPLTFIYITFASVLSVVVYIRCCNRGQRRRPTYRGLNQLHAIGQRRHATDTSEVYANRQPSYTEQTLLRRKVGSKSDIPYMHTYAGYNI